uniref:glycosyltransferase family 2 protein n=2 Tax=Roseivirga sp. TaxID=1964215 RepID=UPI004047D987
MKISVISPVYKAEGIVEELVDRIVLACTSVGYDYEIILVEDGSPDNSWEEIVKTCKRNPLIRGVKLSRNFGQHAAITCGIEIAKGDFLIIMDCDLQDDPKYIPELITEAEKGFDIVYTIKRFRNHNKRKNLSAYVFNKLFNWLVSDQSHMHYDSNIGSYSLITRKVAHEFSKVGDYKRHYLMVLRFLGFSKSQIQIDHLTRFKGHSSYNLNKLIKHALDGIVSQSNKLLRLTVSLGAVISSISVLLGLAVIGQAIFYDSAPGWASTIVVVLFIGGLTIFSIGISALYIGSIAEQVKNRPKYIIDKFI